MMMKRRKMSGKRLTHLRFLVGVRVVSRSTIHLKKLSKKLASSQRTTMRTTMK